MDFLALKAHVHRKTWRDYHVSIDSHKEEFRMFTRKKDNKIGEFIPISEYMNTDEFILSFREILFDSNCMNTDNRIIPKEWVIGPKGGEIQQ
jgi:hypothetical protein